MSVAAEQNKDVIRRFFDAWNSRKPEAFHDLIAHDVVRHCEATPGLKARSLDQVKDFLRQDTAVVPDSVQTIKLLVAEDNLDAAWATYEVPSKAHGPLFHLRVARRNSTRVSFPHRRRKDRRVVGDLGQHDHPQGTRPPSERMSASEVVAMDGLTVQAPLTLRAFWPQCGRRVDHRVIYEECQIWPKLRNVLSKSDWQ